MTFCSNSLYSGAALGALLGLALALAEAAATRAGADSIDFSREVLPILSNKCFVCHGPAGKNAKDLRLDSFEAATADLGGYKAIDPDDPEKSEALARLHDSEDPMPPEDAEKQLTDQERLVLTQWIKEGGRYATHWALVPPTKKQPKGHPGASGSKAIDAFVSEGMEAKGVTFAEAADKATLARRAALVLTGVPPEPVQLEIFLKDESEDAYEKWVESLLASPRYG